MQKGENNPEAIEDLRSYLQLCAMKSQQVVLHDMLEKRYSLRPYGWPDEEVLLLLARLIVLSEINLMMDSTLLPIDKVYEAITTPSKRRKDRHPQAGNIRSQGDPECPQPRQRTLRRNGAGRRGWPNHLLANQAQGAGR